MNLPRAMKAAEAAVKGGAEILEAGTPLIKAEGLNAVRELRAKFPDLRIVADMKTMDAGRAEMEMAAKAGADLAVVLGAAADSTIRECIKAGENYGIEVGVDMIGVTDVAARAKQCQEWGASVIGLHHAIDEQMQGTGDPLSRLRAVRPVVSVPIAFAGGLNSETVVDAMEAGADVLIVGGAIIKSADPEKATREIIRALATGKPVESALYHRVDASRVREILEKVSTANISDGNHRQPMLEGLRPVSPGLKMVGRAVTVRTYPGDWAKPVEAIDVAEPGDVIVIDAGGVEPAVWGELATHSCKAKQVAGVVIHGAIRDTTDIRDMGFPAFARIVTGVAGEPKGLGEINVPITISGIRIRPGDWVVGDDDGVIVLPQNEAVEITNRAMDCLERENRIRAEIDSGKTTLASVMELLKWEKK
ncbi:MAG TPA: orotidine 5'-phosphate decarboxylase / HUMPS family protein [Planctomycetota bacterium]|nr:orotidine 5'-phosphate decarboxylase / HUMPS family protein [Planctomycetota bacterium]